MFVTGKSLLDNCRKERRAVPAFNVYNLETVQAAFSVAAEYEYPVILAFGEKYLDHADFATIYALADALAARHPYPVCLHLDHSRNIENIRKAVAAGFTSVMYDGSELPLAENIARTREAVVLAHAAGVSVEAELGGMNPESGEVPADPAMLRYTSAGDALRLVRETGPDSLAVSIGNAHGVYKDRPHLNMEQLSSIYKAADIPLVLHGSSGIPSAQLAEAVMRGICKINVNTELSLAAAGAVKKGLAGNEKIRFEELMLWATKAMTEAAGPYMAVCRDPEGFR